MANEKDKTLIGKAQDRLAALANTLIGQPQVSFPPFDELPRVHGQPQGCTWGMFDKPGAKDEIGTLNLLRPEVVQAASAEIRSGFHVQLDWCLSENVQFPGFGRRKLTQNVIDTKLSSNGVIVGFDDEIHFNPQSGSQWDGLKHFAHQKSEKYYNGLSHEEARTSTTNGIHRWCERGGIVGRGVLVDWLRWYEEVHGKAPSATSRYEITAEQLEACLKWQGVRTRVGDILIVRSGYARWHDEADVAERKRGTQGKVQAIGLQGSEEMVKWLYNRHFAAVAGDTLAFEAWPPKIASGWCLHEWLLVQWGTPIGELWNLETLSEVCKRESRWTFFLTSAPLHVKGGIGSPPGAIAIF